MSSPWRNDLRGALEDFRGKKTVVVGVGNEFGGDDGVGCLLARRLEKSGAENVIDAGSVPENHCERVVRLAPEMVLVVDAAVFGGAPGEARIFGPGDISGGALSTHGVSLSLFAAYLAERCGCDVVFLGIEPLSAAMGEGLSGPVRETMEWLHALFIPLCGMNNAA